MNTTKGRIELIIGPMFSGKSTELLRRMRRHQIANRKCLVIKYHKDDRYLLEENQDLLSTHAKETCPALPVSSLKDEAFYPSLYNKVANYDVIGIDEGQFFDYDLVIFCDALATDGKIVIVSALSGSYKRDPWASISKLIPYVDDIQMLTAVCECTADAPFTHRFFKRRKS